MAIPTVLTKWEMGSTELHSSFWLPHGRYLPVIKQNFAAVKLPYTSGISELAMFKMFDNIEK